MASNMPMGLLSIVYYAGTSHPWRTPRREHIDGVRTPRGCEWTVSSNVSLAAREGGSTPYGMSINQGPALVGVCSPTCHYLSA
ncbi:hypothetical protein LZ31DRAFT_553182 [Colletotrichum somersetense]|nr:hypothetical protein LZ31DRAFT_553182 [Colletotrichum somersetense]